MHGPILALLLIPAAEPAPAPFRLVSAAQEARLDGLLPRLEEAGYDAALHGRARGRRLLYHSGVMPPVVQYHDARYGPGQFGRPHTLLATDASQVNISINLDRTGSSYEFPWKRPAGTDDTADMTWKVLVLPPGRKIKVFWRHDTFQPNRKEPDGRLTGYHVSTRDWLFPGGTYVFEILALRPSGRPYLIQARHKTAQGVWEVRRYAPLAGPTSATPVLGQRTVRVASDHRERPFRVEVKTDVIGPSPDLEALLRQTFVRSDWAPTADREGAIVPAGYKGAIAVGRCSRCHQDAGKHVAELDFTDPGFVKARDWYGLVRGSRTDRVISFHPFDLEHLTGYGPRIPARLSRALLAAGIIEEVSEAKED